jgi:hypothetical protein
VSDARDIEEDLFGSAIGHLSLRNDMVIFVRESFGENRAVESGCEHLNFQLIYA